MSYQERGEGCTTVGEAHEPCDFALRIVNVVVVVAAAVVAAAAVGGVGSAVC